MGNWDAGGAVVLAMFADDFLNEGPGRFATQALGYTLLDSSASYESPASYLGTVHEPQSPLMAGVNSLSATNAYQSDANVINSGIVVASWTTGNPLVVRGIRASRPLVTLNLYPGPATVNDDELWAAKGQIGQLLRNSLLYSACAPIQPGVHGGSAYTCACNDGYYGNGVSCTKCLPLYCGANAVDSGCISGAFGATTINTCRCNNGYYNNPAVGQYVCMPY